MKVDSLMWIFLIRSLISLSASLWSPKLKITNLHTNLLFLAFVSQTDYDYVFECRSYQAVFYSNNLSPFVYFCLCQSTFAADSLGWSALIKPVKYAIAASRVTQENICLEILQSPFFLPETYQLSTSDTFSLCLLIRSDVN